MEQNIVQVENTQPAFVHLHVHSEYSLFDGAIRIKDLIRKAEKLGHKAIALTDHGNLFAAIEFYTKAKAAGIKPILGCEIFCEASNFSKELIKSGKISTETKPEYFHLVLLAKNIQGYKNLLKIVSAGYTEGLGAVPVVPRAVLEKHQDGLICLSACGLGELGFLVQSLRQH
ncbi:MAG: PHP domain-containing protein, partial [Oligoflexales bacterium]|nr:PHP domain-containing protein [Oligoflexales bacterium]